jgi:hypothetical protein
MGLRRQAPNFVEVPIDARTFYPPETFDRLQHVKRRYDPDDLFHANHRIPSPGSHGVVPAELETPGVPEAGKV